MVMPLVETVAPETAMTFLPTTREPEPLMPTNWSSTGTPAALGSLPTTFVPMPEVSEWLTTEIPVMALLASTPTLRGIVPCEPEAETFPT